MLVVDANVVVDLCVSEIGFDALADRDLVAPPLLRAEALSVLHVMHWRRVASERVIETALDRLDKAPVRFAAPRGHRRRPCPIMRSSVRVPVPDVRPRP